MTKEEIGYIDPIKQMIARSVSKFAAKELSGWTAFCADLEIGIREFVKNSDERIAELETIIHNGNKNLFRLQDEIKTLRAKVKELTHILKVADDENKRQDEEMKNVKAELSFHKGQRDISEEPSYKELKKNSFVEIQKLKEENEQLKGKP